MIIKAYKAIIQKGKEAQAKDFFAGCEKHIRQKYLDTQALMNVNVFGFERGVYIYTESCAEEITPDMLFAGYEAFLCPWPDGENKYFEEQMEIFHFISPQSNEHWRRKTKPQACEALIARIDLSLASRYIFYHYQFQEEQPGAGDKYGRIFLLGDIAFFYRESPEVIEEDVPKGALSTDNTPKGDAWQELMGEHFIWWDEGKYPKERMDNQWLYINNLLSIV